MSSQPYDPTMKDLVEVDPPTWPALVGSPPGPTEAIDADIATVSGAADKVLRVSAATPYLLHLEFVAGHDSATLPRKLLMRNALLGSRHDMLVRSVAILLRPEANSAQLTGRYLERFPHVRPYLTFRCDVIRVWQLSPRRLLSGGLGLLPLALISDVTEADLPRIIERMEQRLSGPRARKQAKTIWAASFLLLGLRYSPELAAQLFRGVFSMKESSTYQLILSEGREEGRIEEARRILRMQADPAFGAPSPRTIKLIEKINDLAQLEGMLERIMTVNSWDELLQQPTTRRRGRPRSE